jgi:CRP/FNR family cyclic AMP-dependent transcriptional regulator
MKEPVDSVHQIVRFLQSLPLFGELSGAMLIQLARASRSKKLVKGSFLFYQSDPAEAVYLVRSGSIAILLISPDGRELVINEMFPGECIGELAVLTGEPRSACALVRRDCEVIVIPQFAFKEALANEPSLAQRLLETNARRLGLSSERESALAFLDAPTRLARLLVELASPEEQGSEIIISQEELARRTSLTRQTIATILGRWRRAGWVVTGRGRVRLLERARLEDLGENPEG